MFLLYQNRATRSKVEGVAELDRAITFDEDLAIELPAQFTVSGKLPDQDLEVIACNAVGVSVQRVPSPTNWVIDGNIATWRTKSRVKIR